MIFQHKVVAGQRLVYSDLSKVLDMFRTPMINTRIRFEDELTAKIS